ncbi:hypothetical protein D3C84_904560 [compost metagenome]
MLKLDLQLFAEEEPPKEEAPSWMKPLQETLEKIAAAVTPKTQQDPQTEPPKESEEVQTIEIPKVVVPPAEVPPSQESESSPTESQKPKGKSLMKWFLG